MEVPHCQLAIVGDLDPYAGRIVGFGGAPEVDPMKKSQNCIGSKAKEMTHNRSFPSSSV